MTTTTAIFTNTCSCETYDESNETSSPADDCYGDCWESTIEFFSEIVSDLLSVSDKFLIEGFPVWNGTRRGVVVARTANELLRAITPSNTEWTLRVTGNLHHLTAILSHHDAPTGGTMTVTPMLEGVDYD
jgi:hypothetical protein